MLLSKGFALAIASLPLGSFAKHAMTYAPGKERSKYEKQDALLEEEIERWEKLKSKPTKTKIEKKGNLFGPLRGTSQRAKEEDCVPMAGAVEVGVPEDEICDDERHRKLQSFGSICVFMPETNGADHSAVLMASGPVDYIRVLGASSLTSCGAPGIFFGYHFVECPAVQNANICVVYNDVSSSEVYLFLKNTGSVRPIVKVGSSHRYFDPISHSVGPSAQYYESPSTRWMARAWPQNNSYEVVAHFDTQSTPLPTIITHHCANPPSVWSRPHGHNRDHDNCPPSSPGGRKLGPVLCTAFVTLAVEAAAEIVIDVLGEVAMEVIGEAGESIYSILLDDGDTLIEEGGNLVLETAEGQENVAVGRVREVTQGGRTMKYVDYGFKPSSNVEEFFTHDTSILVDPDAAAGQLGEYVDAPHDVTVSTRTEPNLATRGSGRSINLGAQDATGAGGYTYTLTSSGQSTLFRGTLPLQESLIAPP